MKEIKFFYIITDGSDEEYTKTLSEKQEWNVELSTVSFKCTRRITPKNICF